MVEVKTIVDSLIRPLEAGGVESLDFLAREAGIGYREALDWVKRLEDIVEVDYSLNVLSSPKVKLKDKGRKHYPNILVEAGGVDVASYDIVVDRVPATIAIRESKGEVMRTYSIRMPTIGVGTQGLLDNVIRELAVKVSVSSEDISNPKKAAVIREKFRVEAQERITGELPVTKEQAQILSGVVLHRIYGLGELEVLLGDDLIEEVCINSANTPIIIYHRRHGWLKSNIQIPDEEDIFNYASQIGRRVGKDITNLNPLMDARLISGDRVMASRYPISSQGNTITIRKFARNPLTVVDFMSPDYNTISPEIAAFMWMCVEYELSVLVAGGTASGKTSMLNSLCAFIPSGQRVVSIEDTREIQLPNHLGLNWIQLTTRNPNPDGLGGVDMLNLILSSLRMRPDRIIVGEIRSRDEAEVLFEAMHTGHSVYSTMHADTCMHVKRRVSEPPISIPEAELEALHVIMTQYRDRLHGIRRTFEVAEVVPGTSERKLELNYLFRWRVKTDTFESIDRSNRVFNDLNLYTGMTVKELLADLEEKRMILEWMGKNKLNSMVNVGKAMNIYYTQREDLLNAVKKGSRDSVTG
jgi:archaeal flagellar protein FlaI